MKATILLLTSDPIVRSVIKEILENTGYTVLPAGDLGAAIDRLKQATPDLLVIHSYIESISGYDAAVFLRTKCKGLPVLMVGGLIDDDRVQYRMSLEQFEVFPKPFTAAVLLDKVEDLLRKVR
jgi:DNA-binding response OmpR family regulator